MINANEADYQDSPLDKLLIWFFSRKMAQVLGQGTSLTGYEGFVDLSKQLMKGRSAQGQQDAVAEVLGSLMPPHSPQVFRKIFPPTKLSCEINAWITKVFLAWLVGDCEITEVEVTGENGKVTQQKSGVHISKCRYLEHSRCVGMCTNMCKLPTQDFFTQQFGLPLTMTPNFEDFSCEMVFGQVPSALTDDPVYHQPCLANQCSMATAEAESCPMVQKA